MPKEKTVVTPNGVKTENFIDIPGKDPSDDYFNIGAILRVTPIKDVKTMITAFHYAHQTNPHIKQREIDEARKNPAILHFTTGLLGRPWEENCRHPHKDKYEKTLESSPWYGRAKLSDTMKLSVKISRFVCEHISSALFGEIYRMTNWVLHR